jgi:ribosomal-protein-alanine N-acetyltransferase
MMPCRVRWMISRDMPEVLAIDHAASDYPWGEAGFLRRLRRRDRIGMVATARDQVVGFMIYELHQAKLHVLNFAVGPEWRRMGVGHQMVAKLVGKLSSHRRTRIVLHVRETNLPAQLFYRVEGFRAVDVVRGWFRDTGEDAYLMEYLASPEPADESGWPARRLADGWPTR